MVRTFVVTNARSGASQQDAAYAAWVRDQGADVTLVSEAAGCLDELELAGSVYAGEGSIPAREVAVVLGSGAFRVHRSVKLTDGLGTRVAPARWTTRVVDLLDGWTVVEYSVHAHAGIQDSDGTMHTGRAAQDWEAARELLERLIRADLDLGREVVVGGDFNMRDLGDNTTAPMFNRLGLRYMQTELLWLAWSSAFTFTHMDRLPNPPGSDHVALRVQLTPKEVPSVANRYPKASWHPLGRQTEDRMTAHDIVCIHTMVGSLAGTLAMFERDGYGGTESHFLTGGVGEQIVQAQDLAFTADANLDGNPRVISIENADKGAGFPVWTGSENVPAFTAKQLDQLIDLVAWLCSREAHSACPSSWKCRTEGIPAVLVPDSKPTRRGIAYHRQGIKGSLPDMWVPGGEVWSEDTGKVCPGDRRVKQVRELLVPAVAELLHPTTPTRVTVVRAGLLEVLNSEAARSINPARVAVLAQLDKIRADVRELPER